MGQAMEIKVPNIGDFQVVEIIDVLVKQGDTVKFDDPLITLESEKASMDVPSPHAGKVAEVKVKAGDRVSEGSLILLLEEGPEAGAEEPAVGEEPAPAKEEEAAAAPPKKPSGDGRAAEPAPVQEKEEKRAEAQEQPQETTKAEGRAEAKVEAEGHRPSPTAALPIPEKSAPPHGSPSVRRFARELGVDLVRLKGSGPRGRILREDVQSFVKENIGVDGQGPAPSVEPQIDFSRFGKIEEVPLTKINQLTGAAMKRSWTQVPHVTQLHDADVTDLDAFRKKLAGEQAKDGPRISLLPFIMKAVVSALRAHPRLNSSLDSTGKKLLQKHYFHIGVAVDTDDGLVVPVIRDVDHKGVIELAAELAEVSSRARGRKLKSSDVEGGSFTISNLGGIGGRHFTPIINAPEVAILGVSRASMTPVWRGETFVPRLMIPLSLSYDHRVVDGAVGARFITTVVELLSDPRRMLL